MQKTYIFICVSIYINIYIKKKQPIEMKSKLVLIVLHVVQFVLLNNKKKKKTT